VIWFVLSPSAGTVRLLLAVAEKGAPSPAQPAPILWYLAIVLLTIALIVAVSMAYRVKREIVEESEPPASNEELLDELREAYALGQMDEVEFRRVTELLTGSKPTLPNQGTAAGPFKSESPPSSPLDSETP
jgi:hypothetical protein